MLFMDTSTRSRINKLTEYIKRNIFLFKSFNNVYLFGSILNNNTIPNDIDILVRRTAKLISAGINLAVFPEAGMDFIKGIIL